MRLHSLTIDNVRAIDHLELRDLPENGVILIHGDNEQGKSTLLDALDALFTIKHTGAPQKMKDFQPVGRDEPPAVAATLTIGPYTFSIAKQWLRRRKAELKISAPQRESFTAGDAEDKLAEILDEHLDRQLLETLFLRQDDLGAGVAAAGIPSLQSALAGAEDSADSAAEPDPAVGDDALLTALEREYQLFYTARNGQPTKRLKQVAADHERARTELEEARSEADRLDSFVEQVEAQESSREEAAASLPEARTALAEAEENLSAARRTAEQAAIRRQQVELAERDVAAATARVTARAELRTQLADLTAQAGELHTQSAAAQEKAAVEQDRLAELTAELTAAQTARATAQQRARDASRTVALLRDRARREKVQEQLAELAELERHVADCQRLTAGRRINVDDVNAVQEAVNTVAVATALRERSVPRLELSAETMTAVTVDGVELSLGTEPQLIELREGTALHIGGVTAYYRAGSREGSDPAADVAAAQQELDELLADLDCADLAEVRAERDRCAAADAQLAQARKDLARALGGQDAAELRAEAEELTAALAGAEASPELNTEQANAAVLAADIAQREAEERVEELEHRLKPWQENSAGTDAATLQARLDVIQEQLTALEADLADAVTECPDEELSDLAEAADRDLAEARTAATVAEQALADADPQLQEELLRGAQARVDALESRHKEANLALARLTSYIDQAAGAAERLQQAIAHEETTARWRANVERRAAAAARLREVVRRHHQAARSRYARPFADELTALARTVFGPDVEFTLSEDLVVQQRSLGEVTVPLAALSGGAKEQLSILTRFAIASLVSRGGSGQDPAAVPVVVDDTLGSTDPRRLQRMGALFDRMGQSHQVIVLTCFPQRYDWVPEKTEYPIAELKTAGEH